MVFFTLLAVSRMVLLTLRIEEIFRYERYSHQDLTIFFRHQLIMKIGSDRKRSLSTDFSETWVSLTSLLPVNPAILDLLY